MLLAGQDIQDFDMSCGSGVGPCAATGLVLSRPRPRFVLFPILGTFRCQGYGEDVV